MKTPNGIEVIECFEKHFPRSLAVEGDKVGLQIGKLNKKIYKIMAALDITPEVIKEAVDEKINLIIAHHPLIFTPLKVINTDTSYGEIIELALKNDIAIYSAHTNLDIGEGGINDALAFDLGLLDTKPLTITSSEELYKLVVYVPLSHKEIVFTNMSNAGAGHIGNYSHCSFQINGKGTFKPLEGTNPYIGEIGEIDFVDEVRIDTIVPKQRLKAVITAMLKAHPYEEVAYDIFPLKQEGKQFGLGKVGYLKKETTLKDFANYIKDIWGLDGLRVIGDLNRPINKVAIVGGDGNKYIYDANRHGADVLITGDVYYHTAHDAEMLGLSMIDAGHNIEKIGKDCIKNVLEKEFNLKKFNVEIFTSKTNTNPFKFL
ncbi:MAG: Nif3-like dinuclear metal center hexameric protein [Bacillales bacterium]|jgi:dinuclear metal center YbgI/SA1388 family protein|nr:Nif3-like dinuclear metal center hexameric protein [Bacillales bacterium]